MKTHICFLFFLILALNACDGQQKKDIGSKITSKKMVEKFDQNLYKKTNYGFNTFNKADGTIISMIDFNEKEGGVQKEILPKPSFKTIYKEFYPNGDIKKKEIYVGERMKIDTSEYYDEKGKIEKVDENKKFGKVKPNDVLKFLEEKKVINLITGDGRFDEDEHPNFEIVFNPSKNEYIITIMKGKPNKGPWDEIGEPPAFLPTVYKMDGETGKVDEVK